MVNDKSKKEKIQAISFIVTLFILSPILSTEETAAPGFLYVMALSIPAFALYFRKTRKKIGSCEILAFMLFASGLVSTALGGYGVFDSKIIKYLLFVLFFSVCVSYSYSLVDVRFIYRCCLVVSIAIAGLIILSYIGGYAHSESWVWKSRYSIGITGLYKNPNYLTSFMNMTLFVLLFSLIIRKYTLKQFIGVCGLLALFLFAFFLTGTRASFATFVIYSVGIIVVGIVKKRLRIVFFLIIVSVAVFIIMSYYGTSVAELLDVFLGGRDLSSDEGRTYSWDIALGYIYRSPIIGCGIGSWGNIMKLYGGTALFLHNVFLELLLNQGAIGIFLFVMLLLSGISKTKQSDRSFIVLFIFVTGFPLLFQNGVVEVNIWRFILLNRIVFICSAASKNGIISLMNDKK